jgi:hypothetical protein
MFVGALVIAAAAAVAAVTAVANTLAAVVSGFWFADELVSSWDSPLKQRQCEQKERDLTKRTRDSNRKRERERERESSIPFLYPDLFSSTIHRHI